MRAEQSHREAQTAQQADSARYLNELNTVSVSSPFPIMPLLIGIQWLETFVRHGTSQIDGVSAGVQHLCRALGCVEVVGEDGQPSPASGGLLADIRQLLAENKDHGENVVALKNSVHGLLAAVQESIHVTEARSQFRKLNLACVASVAFY